jgi:hypothetical protein
MAEFAGKVEQREPAQKQGERWRQDAMYPMDGHRNAALLSGAVLPVPFPDVLPK